MAFVAVAVGAVAAGGAIYKGLNSASAANDAAKQQSNALDQMKAYTQSQMDPALVNQQALEADTERAKNQLALQAQIDPALAQQRTQSEQMISGQLAQIGNAPADQVAAAATAQALTPTPGLDQTKNQLVSAALQELQAGATLPPDVQAELMQSGLQQAGQATGAASGAAGGVGSSILSQVLGTAGINLQAQRQTQAANLAQQAQSLDTQRANVLQGLFPKLQSLQTQNMSSTLGVLNNSNNLLPQAGLTGTQVASDWLSRVGAINQLSSQKANVQAQGALSTAAAQNSMVGGITSLGQAAAPSVASFFNTGSTSGGSNVLGTAASGGGNTATGFAIPAIS